MFGIDNLLAPFQLAFLEVKLGTKHLETTVSPSGDYLMIFTPSR